MVEHHIQKHIIAVLVEHDGARYAELRPKDVDGNIFTYHLRALIAAKLIAKREDGKYVLTTQGKLFGINSSLTKDVSLRKAHSIILLSISDANGRWLLRRRHVQPMCGSIGFIHGEPTAGEPVAIAAANILARRTTLQGAFVVKGSGYVCLTHATELVAYSAFTLIEVTNLEGTLREADSHGENLWLSTPDFSSPAMIPSMADLVHLITRPGLFFLDKSYEI